MGCVSVAQPSTQDPRSRIQTTSPQFANKNIKRATIKDSSPFQGSFIYDPKNFKIHQQMKELRRLVEKKISQNNPNCQLLFRASDNEGSAQKFHEKCDKAMNTIVLIRTQKGKILGGFSSCEWKKDVMYKYEQDKEIKSFVFRLTESEVSVYPIIPEEAQKSIMNDKDCGPVFGDGHDIYIPDMALNEENESWANLGKTYICKYPHGSNKANMELAAEARFKVKDYEVWKIGP